MSNSETLTLRSSATSHGLLLRCERTIDRFQSTILWINDQETETILLRSVEGTPTDDFPPSPPLQQMHLQEINGAPVLLAVGMAGRGHWSASIMLKRIESKSDETSGLRSLVFQYAANLRTDEGWSGCKWIAGESVGVCLDSSARNDRKPDEFFLESSCADHRFRVRPFGLVGCDLNLEPSATGRSSLVVMPTEKNKSVRPIRWEMELAEFPVPNELKWEGTTD